MSRTSNITYLRGDATEPVVGYGLRLLPHICNDVGGWGSGYVLALSKKWKQPEERYRLWAKREMLHEHHGRIQVVPVAPRVAVVNMIAQAGYKTPDNPVPVSYDSVHICLHNLAQWIRNYESHKVDMLVPDELEDTTIHMPRIGCGIGGGDWDMIEFIIRTMLFEWDVYVYDLPEGQMDEGMKGLVQAIENN